MKRFILSVIALAAAGLSAPDATAGSINASATITALPSGRTAPKCAPA